MLNDQKPGLPLFSMRHRLAKFSIQYAFKNANVNTLTHSDSNCQKLITVL